MSIFQIRIRLIDFEVSGVDSLDQLTLKITYKGSQLKLQQGQTGALEVDQVKDNDKLFLQLQNSSEILAQQEIVYQSINQQQSKIQLEKLEGQLGIFKVILEAITVTQELENQCPFLNQVNTETNEQLSSINQQRIGASLDQQAFTLLSFQQDQKSQMKDLQGILQWSYDHTETFTAAELRQVYIWVYQQLIQNQNQLQDIQKLLPSMRNQIIDREECHYNIKQQTYALQQESNSQIDEINTQADENQEQSRIYIKAQLQELELEHQIDMICSRLSKVKQENLSLRSNRLKHSDKYLLIEAAKHKVRSCENLRIKFLNDVENISQQWDSKIDDDKNAVHNLNVDLNHMKQDIQRLKEQENDLIGKGQQMEQELKQKQQQLSNIDILNRKIQEAAKNSEANRLGSQNYIFVLLQKIATQLPEILKKQQVLQQKRSKQSQFTIQLQQKLQKTTTELSNRDNANKNLIVKSSIMEQYCCIREDIFQICKLFKKLLHQNQSKLKTFTSRIQKAAEYINNFAKLVLQETKNTDKLVNDIEQFEYQIYDIKNVLQNIKGRMPLYIPVKDDPIDIALSEYLNTRNQQIPYVHRESEGVYIIGSSRVFLKLENHQIRIHTSGGFNFLDEFLDLCTPQELLRQESQLVENSQPHKDVLTRFNSQPDMNLVRASRIFASEDDLVNQQRNLAKRTNRQIKQVVKGKTPLRKKTPSRYVKKVNK